MFLDTIIALTAVCLLGLLAAYLYPSCIKNKLAFKEFDCLRRAVYSAKTLQDMEECEEWFCEFIERDDLTNEEKLFYDEEFLHMFLRKARMLKST
jgi:hypothetical protein